MSKQNLEALIVINEQNDMVGVVERDQILTKLLLSVVDETKSE
jgi:predicted transcriptional regulator